MDAANARADFHLADWLVEPTLNRVSRGPDVHHLRPRLMDVLVYLARRAGEVVTKDEILAEVWQRQFVAESVLSRSIADLRQILGDEAERPRFIETIPKRGCRVVAAVSVLAGGPVRPAPRRSIVVLPFVDMASGHDQEYFCDGLAEELTNGLAQVRGLRVVARTSAFAFKGRSVDVREIGRQLDVGTVLEGGVQRSGNRVRVTVQLIDASDGCHLWSQRFDRPGGDIFEIEDEIARAVAAALRVRLLKGSEAPLMRARTTDPAAHDLYLKGRHLSARRNLDALQRAAQCFEQAVQVDRCYAAAHAALGECHAVSGFFGFAPAADAFGRAKAAAERALALDPDLAEAYAVLGHETGMHEWGWTDAEDHFRRALDLSPGYALTRVWYSHLLAASGRFDEAIAETERACECDPLSPTVQTTLGLALYHAREHDRAIDRYLSVLDADPSFALARMHLGRAYAVRGEFRHAIEQYEQVAETFPMALGFLASACRRLGETTRTEECIAALEGMSRVRYVSAVAWSCAYLGDQEQYLEWMTRAFDEHEGVVPLLNTDPMVEVRFDPAFAPLFARLGLPDVRPRADR